MHGYKGPPKERFVTLEDLRKAGLIEVKTVGGRGEIVKLAEETGATAAAAATTSSSASGATFDEIGVGEGYIFRYDAGSGQWKAISFMGADNIVERVNLPPEIAYTDEATTVTAAWTFGTVVLTNVTVDDLTFTNAASLTADLDLFTSSLQGVVPASGGGTDNFLRADGTWDSPPGGSSLVYADASVPGGNTVANTVTETAFASTYTIPADGLTVGTVVRIKVAGVYSTDAAVAPTLTLRFDIGGTTMLSQAITLDIGETNAPFHADITGVVSVSGASGEIEHHGVLTVDQVDYQLSATSTTSIDTTGTLAVEVTAQWGAADADDTVTLREMAVWLDDANVPINSDHGNLDGLADDDHPQYPLITSGAGAPASTPGRVGEIYVDTTNDEAYVATDTASSADWDQVTGGGSSDHGALTGLSDDDHTQYSLISSGAGAPGSTPSRVGEIYVDTTADAAYVSTDTASSADWDQITGGGSSDHGALTGLADDDHTQYTLISSGAGAPASTPSRVGEIYIDTTNDEAYVSTDTASSADWDQVTGGGSSDHGALTGLSDDDHTQYSLISSGAGAPGSTPSRVGEIYIDTTADTAYVSTGTASSADWTDVSTGGGGGGSVFGGLRLDFAALATEIEADSPDAFWKFDDAFQAGSSADSSGNSETLTTTTTLTAILQNIPFGFGSEQLCTRFLAAAGTGDCVGTGVVGSPPWSGDLTFVTAVVLEPDGSGVWTLFEHAASGETSATNITFALYVSSTGRPQFFWEYGAGSDQRTDFDAFLPIGAPVLVHVVKDSSAGECHLYVDGQLMDTQSYANENAGGTSGVPRFGEGIGDNGTGSQNHRQAHTALYTTQALSATRVAAHADAFFGAETSTELTSDVGHPPDQPPSTADVADDEFTYGSGIDTSGARFTGANAWTWVNQGSATSSISHGSILRITEPQASGDNWRMVTQTMPSAPFMYRAKVAHRLGAASWHAVAMVLRDSAAGKLIAYGIERSSTSNGGRLQVNYMNSPSSYSSTPSTGPTLTIPEGTEWIYFELEDDSTDLIFRWSFTGVDGSFVLLHQSTRTAFLSAADEIGLGANANNASAGGTDVFVDWFRRIS